MLLTQPARARSCFAPPPPVERRGSRGASFASARAFYAAAVACFAALSPAAAGGALRAAAERAEGLARAFASWAQMELALDNGAAARTLFRQLLSALQVRKYNGFGGLCFASSVHSVCVASVGPPGTIIILIWGVV